MFKHFIAISSIYSKGVRIAWHYSSDNFDLQIIQEFLMSVKKKHGDIQLGLHRLSTPNGEWESVVAADSYFKDVILTESKEDFIRMLYFDQDLTALDVAKYTLSIVPMTHLKLQKIIYLIYERYLKNTGISLFKDEIFAWKYGPVIENVYNEFKIYGSEIIPYEEDDTVVIHTAEIKVTPSFMRLATSSLGETAIMTIHSTLKDYANYDAWELVDLTHKEGSPWSKVYKPGANKRITEEIILAYS